MSYTDQDFEATNRKTWGDYTASFRPMFESHDKAAIPMYSFSRPAYMFWSAFMNGLIAGGMSEKDAKDYLCSKNTRWALDNDLGDQIERLGFLAGKVATMEGR
jgi:hypothetical protein